MIWEETAKVCLLFMCTPKIASKKASEYLVMVLTFNFVPYCSSWTQRRIFFIIPKSQCAITSNRNNVVMYDIACVKNSFKGTGTCASRYLCMEKFGLDVFSPSFFFFSLSFFLFFFSFLKKSISMSEGNKIPHEQLFSGIHF